MAPPDPARGLTWTALFDQGDGLRIVDEHNVVVQHQTLSVLSSDVKEQLKHLRGDCLLLAVQRIMECFGHSVERLGTLYHLPPHAESQLLQQRHHTVEDFRDTAAHPSGVNHRHALTRHTLAQPAQLLNGAITHNGGVINQAWHASFLGDPIPVSPVKALMIEGFPAYARRGRGWQHAPRDP